MDIPFEFRRICSTQVAFHPDPRGILQFIGGYGFGTFPTLFYQNLLRSLFAYDYTIIVLSYPPSAQHFPIARNLFDKHKQLQELLPKKADELGYDGSFYQKSKNYFWFGHSLGCEYIVLLKFLSNAQEEIENALKVCNLTSNKSNVATDKNINFILQLSKEISIRQQGALLLAPCFTSPFFIRPFVSPAREKTLCLIEEVNLFNLVALISFKDDYTAGNQRQCSFLSEPENEILHISEQKCTLEDISKKHWDKCSDICVLIELLRLRDSGLYGEVSGNHYTPITIKMGNNSFIEMAVQFLKQLKEKVEPDN